MAVSPYPSKVCLPQQQGSCASVIDFLSQKFPAVSFEQWLQRSMEGKIHWHDGELITVDSTYRPDQWVFYYREVEQEPHIPFTEHIVYQDAHILIAHKPHFLPVMPGGNYVTQCLQNRLRKSTGINDLIALHRLDRETAGLVMFSHNAQTRPLYHELFASRKIHKCYQAIAHINEYDDAPKIGQQWEVKNRLRQANPSFLMQVVEGDANSQTLIRCVDRVADKALFELQPITGKTHQLRVHMQSLGWPLLYDRFYPTLLPKDTDVYHQPLQLLAYQLEFIDPVTGQQQTIRSTESLCCSDVS